MTELTQRERDVLEFLHRCHADYGINPDAREIGAAVGIAAVHYTTIAKLARLGCVHHEPGIARSTRLTDYGRYMIGVDVCEVWDAEDVL